MGELNRQQICAALGVSESTIRRLEQAGLPYTPVGARSKRYNLDECKAWLKSHPPGAAGGPTDVSSGRKAAEEFLASCRNVRLRVTPSERWRAQHQASQG